MQSVSDQWATALKDSGNRVTKVDVYDRWSTGLGKMVGAGTLLAERINVEFVSVTEDVNSDVRRTAVVRTSDPVVVNMIRDLDPNPLGVEFDISMGVSLPTEELVPKGTFMIDQVSYLDGDEGVELSLVDRSRRLYFYQSEEIFTHATLIDLDDIVDTFLYGASYANFDSGSITHSLFNDWLYSGSESFKVREPLPYINQLFNIAHSTDAGSSGGDWKIYFTAAGVLTASSPTFIDPSVTIASADHVFRPGPSGDLIATDVTVQMNGFGNNIQVGPTLDESLGVYQFWFATVTDAEDITRVQGPAGYRTKIYDATPDQISLMDDMAAKFYWENWGLDRRLDIRALGNPALEADDIIGVELSTGEVVIQAITSITVDSNFGMQITGKGQGIS